MGRTRMLMGGIGVIIPTLMATTVLAGTLSLSNPLKCSEVFMQSVGPEKSSKSFDIKNLLGPYRLYSKVRELPRENPSQFFENALSFMNIDLKYDQSKFDAVPAEGPLVIIANHPMGGIDGVILFKMFLEKRPDTKAIISQLLYDAIPELQPYSIPLNVSDFKSARSLENKESMQKARAHVEGGGSLIVFPGGEVSTAEYPWRTAFDPKWKSTAADIILRANANVVPVYFETQNSKKFQTTGLLIKNNRPTWMQKVGYALRGVMVPYEILNKKGQSIPVSIGRVIKAKSFSKYREESAEGQLSFDKKGFTDYLRAQVYLLGKTEKYSVPGQIDMNAVGRVKEKFQKRKGLKLQPVAPAISKEVLELEVLKLRELDSAGEKTDINTKFELVRIPIPKKVNGEIKEIDISIFILPGIASKVIMQEIGRLREKTFREVNEGTGKAVDVDNFDPFYYQMFVYRNDTKEIAGAYRLGFAEEIIKNGNLESIYTHSLFEFKKEFIEKLGYGVELGRSFVQTDYQMGNSKAKELGTRFSVLSLLWVGLAEVASQNGKIEAFFGPVTISGSYPQAEKKILMSYLMRKHGDIDGEFYGLVPDHGKLEEKSWVSNREIDSVVKGFEKITDLNQFFDSVGKERAPVLVKQYAEHGAKFVTFKDDKDFNTGETATFATDGLIVTRLLDIPRNILDKLLGPERAQELVERLENN